MSDYSGNIPSGVDVNTLSQINSQQRTHILDSDTTGTLMFDYKIVVNKLNEVLAQLKKFFSEPQIEFIQTYINVGEWNLALESLCDLLIEEEIPINLRSYELLQEVGNILNMERKTWEMLKVQVTP